MTANIGHRVGTDPVQVTTTLRPAGPGRSGYLVAANVGGRPPVAGHFEPPSSDPEYTRTTGAPSGADDRPVGAASAAAEVGTRLFEALFSGALRRCWSQAVEVARSAAGHQQRRDRRTGAALGVAVRPGAGPPAPGTGGRVVHRALGSRAACTGRPSAGTRDHRSGSDAPGERRAGVDRSVDPGWLAGRVGADPARGSPPPSWRPCCASRCRTCCTSRRMA